MTGQRVEHAYKDADRNWWRLTLDVGRPDPDPADPAAVDHWWSYVISRADAAGDDGRVWSGEVWSQYDLAPTVEDVMRDFACQAARLAVGFTSAAVEIEGTGR